MKNLIISSMIAFASIGANASLADLNGPLDDIFFENEIQNEATYFDTLGVLYKNGSLPDVNKIKNIAWSGRCFRKEEPSKPISAGQIIRRSANGDVGPIGGSIFGYEVAPYWYPDKRPNYLDNKDLRDIARINPRLKYLIASIKDNSIFANYHLGIHYHLRQSNEYLVKEIVNYDVRTDPDPLDPNIRNQVTTRCYYFIPGLN